MIWYVWWHRFHYHDRIILDQMSRFFSITLQWRHKGHDGVSNHQHHDCLFNCLFSRRSNKTTKLRVTGLCAGNSPGPVNSPHKGPVTRKMFPFDDVIMTMILHERNRVSPASRLFALQLVQGNNTEITKAPHHGASHHKGPVLRKSFHIMTSSFGAVSNYTPIICGM